MALWHCGLNVHIWALCISVVCSPSTETPHRSVFSLVCMCEWAMLQQPWAPMQIMDSSTELEVSSCSEGTVNGTASCSFLDNRRWATTVISLHNYINTVGTVNIGTTTSQLLLPSLSASVTTPLASLLSFIVPHLNFQSNSQSFIIPGTPSNATPSAFQQKPPTVKCNQPFFCCYAH